MVKCAWCFWAVRGILSFKIVLTVIQRRYFEYRRGMLLFLGMHGNFYLVIGTFGISESHPVRFAGSAESAAIQQRFSLTIN
jgi:hypothetical protein